MKLIINNNLFKVKTLLTTKDTQQGMIGKKFDRSFDGMLFFLKKGSQSFWTKNCIINLDIIIINDNLISKIHHNCKPCTTDPCKNFKGYGDMILELKGGTCKKYNISDGDEISFM